MSASNVASALGHTMRTARALTGESLRGYARKLGMSSATLCRIEADKGCDLATLETIRKATGISYAVLLGDKK